MAMKICKQCKREFEHPSEVYRIGVFCPECSSNNIWKDFIIDLLVGLQGKVIPPDEADGTVQGILLVVARFFSEVSDTRRAAVIQWLENWLALLKRLSEDPAGFDWKIKLPALSADTS